MGAALRSVEAAGVKVIVDLLHFDDYNTFVSEARPLGLLANGFVWITQQVQPALCRLPCDARY